MASASQDPALSLTDTGRSVPLSKVLCDALEAVIVSGQMRPGERLNEQQLAQRFGVSRGPIREAIRALEGAGFVEAVTNRGVFVRKLTVVEVRELYDVRAALFGLAGRLLAERASPEIILHLEGLLTAMELAAANRDFDAYYPLNLAFHEAIVDGSGNATLAAQYRTFVKRLTLFRARSLVQGGGLAVSNREHRQMVSAIAARDPGWAQETHWQHVSAAKDRLLKVVRSEAEQASNQEDQQQIQGG
ncbi:MAG: FCD domain-containing protein [Beijerinckiaceae bacterium]